MHWANVTFSNAKNKINLPYFDFPKQQRESEEKEEKK